MDTVHARVATYGVVVAQFVAGSLLAALLAANGDSDAGYAVLAGTLAGAVPNFFFALRLANLARDVEPQERLRAIYIGEAIKIVFASTMLASAIVVLHLSVGYVLGGFLATVLVTWLALMSPLPGERA